MTPNKKIELCSYLFKINNLNSKKIEYYIFIEILGCKMICDVKISKSDGFGK